MSAPQIPNLLTNLKSRNINSSDTNTNTRNQHIPPPRLTHRTGARRNNNAPSEDRVIQQTDDDASGSRCSAVEVGYLEDEFAGSFNLGMSGVRRMPVINRGTYVRTQGVDHFVQKFLVKYYNKKVQIISLGAGTDTRFFRFIQKDESLATRLLYHEIDFPATTSKKINAIERSDSALDLVRRSSSDGSVEISGDKTRLISPSFCVHPVDLREFTQDDEGEGKQRGEAAMSALNSMASDLPTLILSECCLTYMSAEMGTSVLRFFLERVSPRPTPVHFVLYEPLHPSDAFGRTMISNLGARGIHLPGLTAFPGIEDHVKRLKQVGFDGAEGCEVGQWWNKEVEAGEKERLRTVEGLDEEEEWILLASHYGFVSAWRDAE